MVGVMKVFAIKDLARDEVEEYGRGLDLMTIEDDMRETDYCVDIKTLCLASLGFCPAPVELQTRFAIRQFEHGDSLSHRIWRASRQSHFTFACSSPAALGLAATKRRPRTSRPCTTYAAWCVLTFRIRHWSHCERITRQQGGVWFFLRWYTGGYPRGSSDSRVSHEAKSLGKGDSGGCIYMTIPNSKPLIGEPFT